MCLIKSRTFAAINVFINLTGPPRNQRAMNFTRTSQHMAAATKLDDQCSTSRQKFSDQMPSECGVVRSF